MSDSNGLNFEPSVVTTTPESPTMSEIIELTVTNGIPTTTSLAVAERFGKRHDNVLRDIDRLECSKEFRTLNFEEVTHKYVNGKGGVQTGLAYNLTKDGFMFLAMGFTGKEAAAWKERYIAAFNAMEAELLARITADQIPKSDGQLFLSHRADIFVAADRSFRAAMRSGRSAGLKMPQVLRRANLIALEKTGIDMLAELRAEDHLADLEAQQASSDNPGQLGHGNQARFLDDWMALRLRGTDGTVLPFCPCSGAHLHQSYVRWCGAVGETARRAQDLIGFAARKPGWQAGKTQNTWTTLDESTKKVRKMVVPSALDMALSVKSCQTGQQHRLQRERYQTQGRWLTAGFYAFECALGSMEFLPDAQLTQ